MRPYFYIPDHPKPIIVALYRRTNGATEHEGTGILLTAGNRHFLCTAAHVLGSEEDHGLFVANPVPFPLGVFRCEDPKPGAPIAKDLCDLAFTELSWEEASMVSVGSRFLTLDTDTPWVPLGGDRPFLRAFGFLGDDNGCMPNNKVTSNAFYLDMELSENSLNHDAERKEWKKGFINGYYDPGVVGQIKEEFRGCRRYGGLSGGALFYRDLGCPWLCTELAGMLIRAQVDKRARVLFTALRTRFIIEALHRRFPGLPELQPPIPSLFRKSYVR